MKNSGPQKNSQETKKETKRNNNKAMKDKNKNLKELYNKGKVSYILAHGVVSWGISTGIIFIILNSFFRYGLNFRVITENLFSTNNLTTLGIFAAAGAIWGNIMWGFLTKQVEKNHPKRKK